MCMHTKSCPVIFQGIYTKHSVQCKSLCHIGFVCTCISLKPPAFCDKLALCDVHEILFTSVIRVLFLFCFMEKYTWNLTIQILLAFTKCVIIFVHLVGLYLFCLLCFILQLTLGFYLSNNLKQSGFVIFLRTITSNNVYKECFR